MSEVRVDVKVQLPAIDGVAAKLSQSALNAMRLTVANEVRETIDSHLASYAPSHHRTAALLGAHPTGNLENATLAVRLQPDGAVVEVGAKGIRRALGPVEIRPKNKHWLTIPKHPLAYGHSVAELKARGYNIFRPRGKNYLALQESKTSKFSSVLYILAKRAVLKPEPALLPSTEVLSAHANRAARAFIFGVKP